MPRPRRRRLASDAIENAKTYLAGDLPAKLLDNIEDKLGGDEEDMEMACYAYVTHRHSLYGFAHFFGLTWEVDTPSVPRYSLPTATTVSLKLHTDDAKPPVYSVKLVLYNPHCNASGQDPKRYTACPRTLLNIPGCPGECPLAAFKGLLGTRINRTGSYEELCGAGGANPK